MTKKIFLVGFLLLNISGFGQVIKKSDIIKIAYGSLIVGLSGNDTLDTQFKKAIEEFWFFKEIEAYMPIDEAFKKAKKEKNTYVLFMGIGDLVGYSYIPFGSMSVGHQIRISRGKSQSKNLVHAYIPSLGMIPLRQESLSYGLLAVNHICHTLMDLNIKSTMKWDKVFNAFNEEIKSQKLYILEDFLDTSLTESDIAAIYQYPFEIVTFDVWQNAIKDKKEDVVSLIVVPTASAGTIFYIHYFILASESKILGASYARVKSPQFRGSLTGIVPSKRSINSNSAHTGLITEKNIQLYSKLLE